MFVICVSLYTKGTGSSRKDGDNVVWNVEGSIAG